MSQYATTTDLADLGLPADALSGTTAAIQNKFLTKASGKIDSYLRGRYSLPLSVPYPDEIVDACVAITAYKLLKRLGYNPSGYDEQFAEDHQTALDWLDKLSKGVVQLDIAADATPTRHDARPSVYSAGSPDTYSDVENNGQRGW